MVILFVGDIILENTHYVEEMGNHIACVIVEVRGDVLLRVSSDYSEEVLEKGVDHNQ